MMSNKVLHYEVLANQVAGIMVGWAITFFVLPHLLGLSTFALANTLTVLFFVASYSRMLVLRIVFHKHIHNKGLK